MKELITALIAARQAVHLKVKKAGWNKAQSYSFVGHEHVLDHVRATMLANGLILEQIVVEYLGSEPYKTARGDNQAWRWRGTHKLVHVSGEERVYVFEATTGPNDKAAFVASTALDRTAILRIMQLAGSDEENPEHDSNEQDARPAKAAAPKRTLEDVVGVEVSMAPEAIDTRLRATHALKGVADCGITYDGKEPPTMPKGVPPTFPAGEHEGKSMDVVPVGYLRSIYGRVKTAEMKAWAEYLIKAHAYSRLNGGE